MKELKPITEWLEQLPEPYKSQALHNYNEFGVVHSEQPSLADAIECFMWGNTEQSYAYWNDVYKRAVNGEFDSKPEAPQPQPQPKPIGLSKETKILLSVLLRREFDSLPWYSLKEAAPVIIKAASELELTKLVKEMRSDLNFDIKNTK